MKRTKLRVYLHKHATGTGRTELHTVHVERGCSWKEAQEKWAELESASEGFYVSHQVRGIRWWFSCFWRYCMFYVALRACFVGDFYMYLVSALHVFDVVSDLEDACFTKFQDVVMPVSYF